MAKNTESGLPPTGGGESAAQGGDAEGFGPLPRPNVSVPVSGENPARFSEEGVKGIVMNPVYAGVGEYPRMIPDAQWIANTRRSWQRTAPTSFWSTCFTFCVARSGASNGTAISHPTGIDSRLIGLVQQRKRGDHRRNPHLGVLMLRSLVPAPTGQR